jgi:outer membrane lipoprotein carrier protein
METAMLALLLALSVAAPAEPPTASEAQALVRKVQAHYDQTKDLRAKFQQTYTYSGFGRKQTSSGELLVKKPGMMRWEYKKPAPKVVVVKGSRLVQYEPEENQAYVDERFDASGMSAALTFLLGKGDLEKEFDVAVRPGGTLVLRPKVEDPRVESIELVAGPEGQILVTRVIDGSSNVNEIRLEDVKRNVGLADGAFELELPKGVILVSPPGK